MPTITHSVLHTFIAYLSTPNTTEKQARIERMRKKLAQRKTVDRLYLQQNLYMSINNDVTDAFVFINACQHTDRRIKFLGYTGALQIRNKDELLMMVNTLKKDMDRGDVLAVRYLANALEVPVEDIRNEIRFECTREMLVLFYKLYRMDRMAKNRKNAFDDGETDKNDTENTWMDDTATYTKHNKTQKADPQSNYQGDQAKIETKIINIDRTNGPDKTVERVAEHCLVDGNKAEHMVNEQETAIKIQKCVTGKEIPRNALNVLRNNFGKYNTLNRVKQITVKMPHRPPISLQPTTIRALSDGSIHHSDFKRFYSLKIQPDDLLDDILFIKLQIMLDLDGDIKLSQTEQAFLLTLFKESGDNILRTKILQVVTRTTNIKKNKDWTGEISSRLKFPGIYKMGADQVAVVLECLRFMVRHGVAIPDVNVFLYRLLHSYQNNFVFFALDVLRTYRVFDKQVIDKCLKMETVDHLAYDTLLGNISKKTARFAFKKIEKTLMLFSNDENVQKIIKKIIDKGSDRLLVSIIKNYPNLGYFYNILHKVKDKTKLKAVRDFLNTNLNVYGVDLMCQLFEMNIGFDLTRRKTRYYDTTEDDEEMYEELVHTDENKNKMVDYEIICSNQDNNEQINASKSTTGITNGNRGSQSTYTYVSHIDDFESSQNGIIEFSDETASCTDETYERAINNEPTRNSLLEHRNKLMTEFLMDDLSEKVSHVFTSDREEKKENYINEKKKTSNPTDIFENTNFNRINRKYTTFYKKGLKVIAQTMDQERLKVLDHLISVCLRYGNVRSNKELLIRFLRKTNDREIRGMIEKGIEYFELIGITSI
ncbi:hypothetical protein THOM_1991 [Trachipleistophora hominis]|uniref:Uncharacterized protein n=1 Tax=Trachipleistophora hominis TaxID=72359 RepID=L7JWD5_TRAHO|nr:hypothetical protein THOM_1991 [Trachipleistophora hominis]